MRIVVLTGLSGSGKSYALRALEDIAFYAIDNLPVPLFDQLVELFSEAKGESEKLALVVDARTAAAAGATNPVQSSELNRVPLALERTRVAGHEVDLVFLDAQDDVLVRRYSETRRRHPLSVDGSVREGILAERALLAPLQAQATLQLDTSGMSVHELRRHIQETFKQRGTQSGPQLQVTVMSFGFKHGLPPEADLVFDVRFISNPYFVEDLRPKTGEDREVQTYVLDQEEAQSFLRHLKTMLEFLLPQYEREGKAYLTIALGCTGGRHRSVVLTSQMSDWVLGRDFVVRTVHRDIRR